LNRDEAQEFANYNKFHIYYDNDDKKDYDESLEEKK